MPANKKVIYTVITNQYDHLFPPLEKQDGWDLVCFSDDAGLVAKGWTVKPLPALPELEALQDDPVRAARMVKILPHRFLQEYDYSLFMDGNRVLVDKAETFVQDCSEPLLCLEGRFIDPYAAADLALREDEKENPLAISPKKPLDQNAKDALLAACERWKKEKLPEYCGCPGTGLLGRAHHEKNVIAAMEAWAQEVLNGPALDELALPYACHVQGLQWAERLSQSPQQGWLFSEAERLAPAMQHIRVGEETEPFVKPVYEENPPPPGGPYDGYPYLLTIGVPVSNQIGTIKRCLDGIKPILDALPSELVVVDTGSTDGTVEVCLEYGARVVKFPWCDDMSAARNTCIRAAQGSWFMSIDDDEWFEDTAQIIEFFQTGTYKRFTMGVYNQRNYTDKNMTECREHPTVRMGKMTPCLHFEGRIHDALMQETTANPAYIASTANHLGFVKEARESIEAKSKRNVQILRQEVAHYPEDLRFSHQLMKEYSFSGRQTDAVKMAYWVISLSKNENEKSDDNAHWAEVEVITALLYLGANANGKEAIVFFGKFIDLPKYNYLATCAITYVLAQAYAKGGGEQIRDCKKSNDYGKAYFSSRQKYMALTDADREMQWALTDIDRIDTASVFFVAATMLNNYQRMDKPEEADAFLLGGDMVAFFCEEGSQDYRVTVTEYALRKRRFDLLKKLLARLVRKHGSKNLDYLYAIISEQADEATIGEVEAIVEKAAGKDTPFLAMLRLPYLEENDQTAAATFQNAMEYVRGTLFTAANYFRGRLLFEAFRLHLDVDAAFGLLDRTAMDGVVNTMHQRIGWGAKLYDCLMDWWQDVPQDAPSMQRYLAFQVAAAVFMEKEKNRELEPEAYVESFTTYVRRRYAWEKEQAADGLLDGDGSENLPLTLRALCAANHALDLMESGQNTDAMRSLKVVMEQDPAYKHVVALLVETLKEKTAQQLDSLSEMDLLLAEVKPKLHQLLAAGEVAEVKAILGQLEQIAPNDAELIALRKQLNTL